MSQVVTYSFRNSSVDNHEPQPLDIHTMRSEYETLESTVFALSKNLLTTTMLVHPKKE